MIRPDPAKIIVPRKHGEVLIEPALPALATAVQRGVESGGGEGGGAALDRVALDAAFGNIETFGDFAVLRSVARQTAVNAARHWAKEIGGFDLPENAEALRWIVTGHQVEFYHAGVWAKVLAAEELARRVSEGGLAIDLLVDHDVVNDLGFEVPFEIQGTAGGQWKKRMISFGDAVGLPADALAPPSGEQFDAWEAELAKYVLAHADALAFFLTQLCQVEAARSYTQWMSRARAAFERSLGLRIFHLPVSRLLNCESWLVFVMKWIEHAEPWTAAYNRHLAAYRRRQGIKNPQQPMPDLARKIDGAAVIQELPFWAYRVGQPRQRLMVRLEEDTRTVLFEGVAYDVSHGLAPLLLAGAVVRPRALTLTMYIRLFVADVFVHGIGGALYDQITDGLMAELFQSAPPYGCVSAAWLLPIAQTLAGEADVASLKARRHHLLHNPQLVITSPAELLAERTRLVEEIAQSLETRRRDATAWRERRQKFQRLHEVNRKLHAMAPDALRSLEDQLAAALANRQRNKVLFYREYFFGLHTVASLKELLAAIHAA